MSGSKAFAQDLAARQQWPMLIEELGRLDISGVWDQLLYVDSSGWCVFMKAAVRNAPAPVWKALIEAALRAGLDIRAILTRAEASKETVLHWAAYSSDNEEVAPCLAFLCPSALDMKNDLNRTPLEDAKANNRPSSVIAALTQATNDLAGFQKHQLEVSQGGAGKTLDTGRHSWQSETRPTTRRPAHVLVGWTRTNTLPPQHHPLFGGWRFYPRPPTPTFDTTPS